MSDFFTAYRTIGTNKPDLIKLRAAIEKIASPTHAIILAAYRSTLRDNAELMACYCAKVESIAERFTTDEAAKLQDAFGKKDADPAEGALMGTVRSKARKPQLIGSRH